MALLNYDELRDGEMTTPSHIIFRISPHAPNSVKPTPGGALYARVNVRGLDAFRNLQENILKQMHISSLSVMKVEYHRDGSHETRNLNDLFEDNDFICGLGSHNSKDWTLYINIVGSGVQTEEELPKAITVQVNFLQGSWNKKTEGWKPKSIKKHHWKQDSIQCSWDTSPNDLPDRLGDLIQTKARKDEPWKQALALRMCRIGFVAGIHFQGLLLSLEDGKTRIATLLEMFKNSEEPLEVDVTVVLAYEKMRNRVPETKDLVYRFLTPTVWTYIRRGNVSDNKREVSTSTEAGTDLTRPHSDFALLAYSGTTGDAWTLCSTHVYDFQDYCIGDMDDYRPRTFSPKHDFFSPFEESKISKTPGRMIKLLNAYDAEDRPKQVGSGVPFLPHLSFTTLTSENAPSLGLGVEIRSWTNEDHIDIAVRCFCHIEGISKFPDDMVIEHVTMVTLPEKIRKMTGNIILKQLPHTVDSDDKARERYASKLFEEDRVGQWDMQLWVMPQMAEVEPKERKLYLWSKDGEDVGELLDIFFDQRSWDEGNRGLYMEAHFFPKGKSYAITGSVLCLEL